MASDLTADPTATTIDTDDAPGSSTSPGGLVVEDAHRKNVQIARLDGVDIAYETFGKRTDPAILLVMGLGTQMLGYHEDLCSMLADAGHFVIRFDNRDSGLSTHWPDVPQSLLRTVSGRGNAYTVTDMANDAFQLADHLELDRFHLVGTSMGGFIAQTMAIEQPERIRSLTLVMTSTGSRRVGRPTTSVMLRMARAEEPTTREEAIEGNVETYRIIGSPNLDEDEVRRTAAISWDRSPRGKGRARQLAAIMAQPNRTEALRDLDVPTLVVHGLADPLVTPSGGLALAQAIPGAVFVGHHGMGHDLTRSMWETLGRDLLDHIERRGR